MYISDAPFYLDVSTMMSQSVKEGLDTSSITQMFVNSEKQVVTDLKMKDPEEDKKVEKLQEELFEQKLISKYLKRQLAEVKEEQKAILEGQAKRLEDIENTVKKQFEELKAMMSDMRAMMKKLQQQP